MNQKFKTFLIIFTILIITYLFSTFFYQLTLVQGQSMSPTLAPYSLVIIDKHTKNYSNGDIIVFHAPKLKATCIKRIIACENDSIEIKNGLIYVNNTISPFQLSSIPINYAGNAEQSLCIPSNQYFVLGDNYNHSIDSRYEEIGLVQDTDILGKVIFGFSK